MMSSSPSDLPLCAFISTGGTIAMKIDPIRKAPVPALSGDDLLATVPAMAAIATLEVNNLFNLPSDYMDPPRWIALQQATAAALDRPEISGVIISHGTDTLEETAWFLDLTLSSDKPVVLIGAQRNASSPDFDGPRNLLNAARICVCPESRDMGVMIAMNNQINAARDVSKTHTADVETFKSGDFGVLGVADEDRIVFARRPLRRQYLPLLGGTLPRVEIIPMFGGASGDLLRAAVSLGTRGIVIQALGFGNVNAALYEAIREAIVQGVTVVISTRVANGRVLPSYGFDGGGATLKAAGAIFADDLSAQKARILLMLGLQSTHDATQLQALFDR
ncbi:asparaginase [Herbaspirillum rubrisubalbicans]|jgi:L-asparaginase|uniref:Asparaginase n=1 Tax=Herbaspirillum rubrisubalbicans TaxID=80842 RepID=A0ABX9C191_9BURK|nr:asparaginase [Herbaspirillum rubrisubalbicans]MCP1575141.1 L-asparaginase [Herbaspirillum rubrisubalbicans]NQE49816.1 asparaginase [Herbaspirillum rubrisubalbicans]RAM63839.1 asparaginase [Herbaspirillum rubrisubalbicans]RAN44698.1 asparaginase [Herbaspirillum rubrisubalbicans]